MKVESPAAGHRRGQRGKTMETMETMKNIEEMAEALLELYKKTNNEMEAIYISLGDEEKTSLIRGLDSEYKIYGDGIGAKIRIMVAATFAPLAKNAYPPSIQISQREGARSEPMLSERLSGFLADAGVEGWRRRGTSIEKCILYIKGYFFIKGRELTGRKDFSDPVSEEKYLAMEALWAKEAQEKKIKEVERKLGEKEQKIAQLSQQVESKSAELAELRREQRTKEEIAAAMAKTLAVQSELALANLRLAAQKAVADLAATKGISKSRRFAQIRKDLEATINPPTSEEDYRNDSED